MSSFGWYSLGSDTDFFRLIVAFIVAFIVAPAPASADGAPVVPSLDDHCIRRCLVAPASADGEPVVPVPREAPWTCRPAAV